MKKFKEKIIVTNYLQVLLGGRNVFIKKTKKYVAFKRTVKDDKKSNGFS